MSTTGWAVTVLAVIIILGGAWWYISSQPPANDATINVNTGANAAGTMPEGSEIPSNGMVGGDADARSAATTGVTVRYTATGFVPETVTIQAGQKVTFVNDGASPMWVASDEHPTHTEFDGTDRATHCSGSYTGATPFDQCIAGPTYTYVFTKAGTYDYHNHSAAQFGGTVVVQ